MSTKTIIRYEVKRSNIRFYSTEGLELGVLPLDSTTEQFKTFFDSIQDLKVPEPEIVVPPYTAADIFTPSGRLRGINLTRDEFGGVKNVSFIVNHKAICRIDLRTNNREANIKYLVLRICLHHQIDESSITAILVETSLREMFKLRLEK